MKAHLSLPLLLCFLLPIQADEEKPAPDKAIINKLLKRTVCSNAVMSMHEAVMHRKWDILDQRIAEGFNLNETDELGNTALHYAVQLNRLKGVRILINAGANPSIKNKLGRLPQDYVKGKKIAAVFEKIQTKRDVELKLVEAIRKGNTKDVLHYLTEEKISPNIETNEPGETLLMLAVKQNNPQVAEMLIKHGANVNKKDPRGLTAINEAAGNGRTAMVKVLLENGADATIADNRKVYPLTNAAWSNNYDTIAALLPHYKSMNFTPPAGNKVYPVARAIRLRQHRTLQLLLDSGLKIEDPLFREEPLLIIATKSNNEKAVRMLLKAGANPNVKDSQGKTASDYANSTIAPLLRS